jgi:hypothetical protein
MRTKIGTNLIGMTEVTVESSNLTGFRHCFLLTSSSGNAVTIAATYMGDSSNQGSSRSAKLTIEGAT